MRLALALGYYCPFSIAREWALILNLQSVELSDLNLQVSTYLMKSFELKYKYMYS